MTSPDGTRLKTPAEVDEAIAEAQQRLAQYRLELDDAAADGQDPTRARALVELAERQLALLSKRRQDLLAARIIKHRGAWHLLGKDPSSDR